MTVFSKFLGNSKAIREGLREQERIWPPPVSFIAKSKRTKPKAKSKDEDSDNEHYRSFEVQLDPDDEDTETYKMKVQVFEDGTAEDWIRWRKKTNDVFEKLQANGVATKQHQIYSSLLIGKAKENYLANWNS